MIQSNNPKLKCCKCLGASFQFGARLLLSWRCGMKQLREPSPPISMLIQSNNPRRKCCKFFQSGQSSNRETFQSGVRLLLASRYGMEQLREPSPTNFMMNQNNNPRRKCSKFLGVSQETSQLGVRLLLSWRYGMEQLREPCPQTACWFKAIIQDENVANYLESLRKLLNWDLGFYFLGGMAWSSFVNLAPKLQTIKFFCVIR